MSAETAPRTDALEAQARAFDLLAEIEALGLVAPGRNETDVEADIYALAERRFGVSQHWHRRIVRSGPNTLTTAADFPDARVIGPDDTVYVDLGPVFDAWEADVGRTYAMGPDPRKRKLVDDLPKVFARVREVFLETPDITGAELYAAAVKVAADHGWSFGGQIAGHIIGEFNHRLWPGDPIEGVIFPANPTRLRAPDHLGRDRHWILEIHLVDPEGGFGGFYEALL